MSENGMQLNLAPIARKSHRKSRLGCQNCKRRRIKCNEVHPRCGNCARHQLQCDFNTTNPVISPTRSLTADSGSIPTPPTNVYTPALVPPPSQPISYIPTIISLTSPNQLSASTLLNPTDLYLWHHFFMNTCHTFNPTASSPKFWQQILPSLGFTHNYILHLILGISSLHLSRLSPSDAPAYHHLAEHHHSTALPSITTALSNITPSTSEPVYAAAVLICFYTLAKGPQEGEYIAFSSSPSDAQWLYLLRGMRNIHDHGGETIHDGIIQPLIYGGLTDDHPIKPRTGPVPDFRPPLRKFREYLVESQDDRSSSDTEIKFCLTALDSLWRTFVSVYEDAEQAAGSGYSNIIFAWLYRVEEEFTRCLREHKPFALVILSYFAVLMRELESQWFIEGWVEHVLKGVEGFLQKEYRTWIEWPVDWIKLVRMNSINGN